MSSYKENTTSSGTPEHLIGRVKWFNNKAGYGFVTVTDGSRSGSDVFVHHNAINVDSQQYKYLVQGEYIEFDLIKTDSDKHEWQASHVSGIKGGKLMCETRNELKIARNDHKANNTSDSPKMPRQKTYARTRGEGPRDDDKKEWKIVGDNVNKIPRRTSQTSKEPYKKRVSSKTDASATR